MGEALTIWRKKLDFLQQEEAKAVDAEQKFNLAERIKEARTRIAELDVKPSDTSNPAFRAFRADISRIIKYAPAELIGREAETKLLTDAWDKAVRGEPKRPHVLTFVSLGGEGRTSDNLAAGTPSSPADVSVIPFGGSPNGTGESPVLSSTKTLNAWPRG